MPCTWTVKKAAAIAIAVIMIMTVFLTGCAGSGGAESSGDASQSAPGTIISETDSEITVVDQAGREVTVGKDVQSIALSYRVIIRFLLNLGQGDKITGIGKSEPFLEELQPSLADCADVGKGVADIEALAELEPDIYLHKASDVETLEAVEKIGIPAVGIEVETPEDMLEALDLLGKVLGVEERAAELSDYYRESTDRALELTGGIEDKDKKTAIVMGSSRGKVADGTMLQGMMLEMAGAVNCAADLKASELWPTAGTEQIFKWDPDYIFITGSGSADYGPEDIYSDSAWSELKAVKNRHVYVIPSEKDSWEFPGVVSVLGTEFMINTMYPELLSEEQLEKDAGEFYEMAYGKGFTREELGY